MAVGVPPHCPVDVDVLDEQSHEQIEEQEKLEQEAAVQGQLWDPRVSDRLWSDESRERGRRQTQRATVPVPDAGAIAQVSPDESLQRGQGRAAELLSAGTPATSGHGRQLPRQPRTTPTDRQPPGHAPLRSLSHHKHQLLPQTRGELNKDASVCSVASNTSSSSSSNTVHF